MQRIGNGVSSLSIQRAQRTQNSVVRRLSSSLVDNSVGAFQRCLARPSFSVPLACLSIALFAPAPARAGCDYPTHIERNPVEFPNGTTTAAKSDTPLPHKPCSCTGPHCSRQPLAPSAPTSVESVKISEWGRLLPLLLLVQPASDRWTPETVLSCPLHHPSVIYHPPRLSR